MTTTILIVVLFILQFLSFSFIVLLNSKLNKYKEIEQKQESIIREMDESISNYLLEIKDENDRLIKELTTQSAIKQAVVKQPTSMPSYTMPTASVQKSATTEANVEINVNQPLNLQPSVVEASPLELPKYFPKAAAASAYKKQAMEKQPKPVKEEVAVQNDAAVDQMLTAFEQEVVNYHRMGLSIEEIAKKTQKGKTEIELLIKFHA